MFYIIYKKNHLRIEKIVNTINRLCIDQSINRRGYLILLKTYIIETNQSPRVCYQNYFGLYIILYKLMIQEVFPYFSK